MRFVVRFFIIGVLLTVPLACSQMESGRKTSSASSEGAPDESSRIIPESRSTDHTAGTRDESTRENQAKQPSDQPRDTSEVAKPRTTTDSERSSQPVGGSESAVEPNKPEDANWDSNYERGQVDVRQERLKAAQKKLRELSRKQKKQSKSQSRQAKRYQQQAISRLEKHMNERGWKNFSFGEPSSENEGLPEFSGTDEENDRE